VAEGYAEIGQEPRPAVTGGARRSGVRPAASIPTPPFWGPKTIRQMPLEIVFQHLHRPELFRLSWGARNAHGEEWERLQAEYEARLARMQKDALARRTLAPQAVYGYFPVNSDGDDLIVWDWGRFAARGERVEAGRFRFPRQNKGEFLCLSDYFAPAEGEQVDVAALQVATVGREATAEFERLQAADNYSEAYFSHGLAVQTAEATAAFVHEHIRRELRLAEAQGKRYSWGYPACPDLADHALVFALLPAVTHELGMTLTPSYQLVPEQSTAAIVVHHPEAKYYSVEIDRVKEILGEQEA